MGRDTPCQVKIWSSVKIQFILQHLLYSSCRCALLRDLKLRDLLLRSITTGVRGALANGASTMNMSLVCFMRMVVEELDELVWINLHAHIGTLAPYLIRALQGLFSLHVELGLP